MTVKKWYLIRHGETDFNKKRFFYGKADVSINETGKEQASNIHQLLKGRDISRIYTSQLKRTQETATIIFPDQIPKAYKALNERDFGLWEGRTANEIQAAFPLVWEEWLESPFDVTPSKAEPFQKFKDRVQSIVEEIRETDDDEIAIVGHLGVLRLIYQFLVDPEADFWSIDIPQGTVLLLEDKDPWEEMLLTEGGEKDHASES
ncbi:alpha-ribazole-5'-phosphate phosphatase [Streptococcus australis]|jgi:alpha-ribazole-5'-phosphate phosphatase, putative|uniref:Phosphoglycerate mutase family protein n=1 Tax=Streptococcus australis ATCC 700641 TaxID=888833 RepID=E7SAW2_9STRE|nr:MULTISPECIES: histidine phosphatase family protein [Streptococcus]EFV99221.1 phosphoglycerate mutase family protein [Streptococcus australis ATCC 700641]EGU63376.1 phosphoglycerate mutase family protein [Streptococcus australis ATCC 700641]MBZ2091139.1 histidine phosphatase family protein [Streptococcus parasanguinis]MCB6479879.1 histidine phosphatase family protein [Streptococcus parasanguinis]MCB7061179.1 histidine phosphatase family protein [Streptococcus sp. 210928-DFI.4.42]